MSEQRWFEVDIVVRGADPSDTVTVSREYRSLDAASADKASREIVAGISPSVQSRMKEVSAGD